MGNSDRKLNPALKTQIEKTLAQTLVDLRDVNESLEFLKDFLTESEFNIFTKRLAIAYWLKKKRSYANIKENLKVSSATIASTLAMMKGKGFQMALKKIEAEEWANLWSEKIKKFIK